MRAFLKSSLAAVLVLAAFGGAAARAEEGKGKDAGKAAHTCNVTYYCNSPSGEQGPYDTTAGVEERKCATNSSPVFDSLRGICGNNRGPSRISFAIWGPVAVPPAERCNVAFRCPGNSQTLRLSLAISNYACKNGYIGAFRDFKQDIPYYKYHNEFTRSLAFVCPSASAKVNSSGIGRNPTSIDSVQWALPPATPHVNPPLNCVCTTRCYGPRTGWTDEVEFNFQVPFSADRCLPGYTRERTQAACTARASDTYPQSTRNYRLCVESFASGSTTGTATSSLDWSGDGNQTANAGNSGSAVHDWGVTQ